MSDSSGKSPEIMKTTVSPAALRMRRSRERRRQGDMVVSLTVGPSETTDLVGLGWLPVPGCGDKDALTSALIELVERGDRVACNPGAELAGQSQLHARNPTRHDRHVVAFGWLPADQQDDLSAIAKAFRRFAGRALAVARNCGLDRWYIP